MGMFDKIKNARKEAEDALNSVGTSGPGMPGGKPSGILAGINAGMDDKLKYRELAQKLSASGIEAPAVIKTITRGETDALSGSVSTTFEVMIKPTDGDPFPATIKQAMLPAGLDTMAEGDAYTVKYDPDDRTKALIYGQI
jgi:hypothetical protein